MRYVKGRWSLWAAVNIYTKLQRLCTETQMIVQKYPILKLELCWKYSFPLKQTKIDSFINAKQVLLAVFTKELCWCCSLVWVTANGDAYVASKLAQSLKIKNLK